MQRRWQYTTRGEPSKVLSLVEVPIPTELPNETSVIVKVAYAAFNAGDALAIRVLPTFQRKNPAVPTFEFSGTVVKAGSQVREEISMGSKVFGYIYPLTDHLLRGEGALSEYVVVPDTGICLIPHNGKMEELAGLTASGCTSLQAIRLSRLRKGDSVLINGASGGVGIAVVQFVRMLVGEEGKIFAVCSGRNAEFVKKYGVDEVVDYTQHSPLYSYLAQAYSSKPFDEIIDVAGSPGLYENSPSYLKKEGLYMQLGNLVSSYTLYGFAIALSAFIKSTLWPRWLGGTDRDYKFYSAVPDLKSLIELKKLHEEGKIRCVNDSVWEMEDALKAYEIITSQRARGKVVVKVTN